jgi:hypothetical protein
MPRTSSKPQDDGDGQIGPNSLPGDVGGAQLAPSKGTDGGTVGAHTRTCLGCDGSGDGEYRCYDARHETACPLPREVCENECDPELRGACCLACKGSGRVPECIPARDAIADAETLRIVVADQLAKNEPGALRNIPAALEAFNAAASVEWPLRVVDSYDGNLWGAELAAHGAFLAVPALRGESR